MALPGDWHHAHPSNQPPGSRNPGSMYGSGGLWPAQRAALELAQGNQAILGNFLNSVGGGLGGGADSGAGGGISGTGGIDTNPLRPYSDPLVAAMSSQAASNVPAFHDIAKQYFQPGRSMGPSAIARSGSQMVGARAGALQGAAQVPIMAQAANEAADLRWQKALAGYQR